MKNCIFEPFEFRIVEQWLSMLVFSVLCVFLRYLITEETVDFIHVFMLKKINNNIY